MKRYETFYLFWDVESTSNDPLRDDIIAIGAILTTFKAGKFDTLSKFETLVNTPMQIDPSAQLVHRITKSSLRGAPDFGEALELFRDWVQREIVTASSTFRNRVMFLAHNGSRFDELILFCNCINHGIKFDVFMRRCMCHGFIDTLKLLKHILKQSDECDLPTVEGTGRVSYTLGCCHERFCGGKVIENAHDALVDSKALVDIFNSDRIGASVGIGLLYSKAERLEKAVKRLTQSAGLRFRYKVARLLEQHSTTAQVKREKPVGKKKRVHPGFEQGVPNQRRRYCLNCVTFLNRDEEPSHSCADESEA